jgi:Holliday junction resolvase RusA-like endonuclease
VRVFFIIPGKPRGKARPRSTARIVWPKDRNGEPRAIVTVYSDPDMEALEAEVLRRFRAAAGPAHQPHTGPIKLNILAVMPIPQSFSAQTRALALQGKVWHRGTPDLDNIEKLIADALNRIAWIDDGQVAVVTKGKRYGEPERVEVTIEALDQPPGARTPAQRDLEKRLALGGLEAVLPRKRGQGKGSKTKKPAQGTPLERAISAALDREGPGKPPRPIRPARAPYPRKHNR